VFLGLAAIPIFFSVFYLNSKAVLISVFVILMFLAYVLRVKLKTILIFTVLAIIIMYSSGFLQKAVHRFRQPRDNLRLELYLDSLNKISKNPFIGVGLGNKIRSTNDPVTHYDIFTNIIENGKIKVNTVDAIDSLYLNYAFKMGLPFMILMISFLIYLFWQGRFYGKITDEAQRAFVLGMFCMFPGFFIESFFGFPFMNLSFSMFFWFILGIYARIINNSKNTSNNNI
jgi:O-antigen ligase